MKTDNVARGGAPMTHDDLRRLRELVIEAWLLTAPKRVARQLEL